MFRFFLIFAIAISVALSAAYGQGNASNLMQKYKNMAWDDYRVDVLRGEISTELHGDSISLISVKKMVFLSKSNMYAQKETWSKAGILWPDMIVLADGRYDIPTLHQFLNDDNIIEKTAKSTYFIKRPIYISSTASLLINKNTVRLSLSHGVFIVYHGGLDVLDSRVTSWDSKKKNFGEREYVENKKLLLVLAQNTRPYLLGLEGSFTKMVNSNIVGLGYKGNTGSYGISLMKPKNKLGVEGSIEKLLKMRGQPGGIFIGNNISQCFFGFYTDNAKDVIFSGNALYDNVIYNIDPHDYSTGLVIAKNISYKAVNAHGIIISREVNDSIIADNIIFSNSGSGIMLDRSSENNLIHNNLSVFNKGDGISIYESSKNILTGNTLMQNRNNGLFVRNSSEIRVYNNFFSHNGNNGAEISVVNIDYLETRDFTLDPYDKESQALFENNTFTRNMNSALSIKNGAHLFFKDNIIQDSSPLYFSGEIESLTPRIIKENTNRGFLYNPKKTQ